MSILLLFYFFIYSNYSVIALKNIADQLLQKANGHLAKGCNSHQKIEWDYTNFTYEKEITLQEYTYFKRKWFTLDQDNWKPKVYKSNVDKYKISLNTRQFYMMKFLIKKYEENLRLDKVLEMGKLRSNITNIYDTSKVCAFKHENNCTLSLKPDLENIMANSKNYDELQHIWKVWRDVTGKPIKVPFTRYFRLYGQSIEAKGFGNVGDFEKTEYDVTDIQNDVEYLWQIVRPLYLQLHAYVRRKLIKKYGNEKVKPNGPIPAHLLGNMWGENWQNIFDEIKPYPDKPSLEIKAQMIAKQMNPRKTIKVAEKFFVSLGLKPMPELFWNNSIIKTLNYDNADSNCDPAAYDFCDGKDFRVKLCLENKTKSLLTAHRVLSQIQYFMQYAHQPYIFRFSPNPAFSEAVADAITLSAATLSHLKQIGYFRSVFDDHEQNINFLLQIALEKIAFLPYGYLLDLWRWGAYSGDIKLEKSNTEWWKMRLEFQGLCPPIKRTEENFDPAAYYAISKNIPSIRHFISIIMAFQFHEALCRVCGFRGPLHKCSIYNCKNAGNLLRKIMEKGTSQHWYELIEEFTGISMINPLPIWKYFKPLYEWLQKSNQDETIGWHSDDPTVCP